MSDLNPQTADALFHGPPLGERFSTFAGSLVILSYRNDGPDSHASGIPNPIYSMLARLPEDQTAECSPLQFNYVKLPCSGIHLGDYISCQPTLRSMVTRLSPSALPPPPSSPSSPSTAAPPRYSGQAQLTFRSPQPALDTQDKRPDGHDRRLDCLTDEISELRRLTVGISERVSRSEGEIDLIGEQLRIADTPSP